MKRKITCIIFLLYHALLNAQPPSSFYLNEVSNGGQPFYTADNIYFQYNNKMVKTDYQGNIIWSKEGMPMQPIFQGDVFYGFSYVSNNFYISKLDTAGNYIWTKDITSSVCALAMNHFNTIRGFFVNQDRIYISSGQYSLSMGYDGANAMTTLDTSGNVINSWCDPTQWPMTLTFISAGYPSFLPGGWISFTSGGVGQEITLVKLNYDGSINTSIPAIQIDMGISVFIDKILMLHDSTYLALCRIDNNQMGTFHDDYFGLSKFTENGTVLWQKVFQTQGDTGIAYNGAIDDTMGNIYMISGLMNYTYNSFMAMKIDPGGNILFSKQWNDSSITTRLEIFKPTLKDDKVCCGIHYIDNAQRHEGIMVFDTLFSSCLMNGIPYSLTPGPAPIYNTTFQSYNTIAYSTAPGTLSPTNAMVPFISDLCAVVNVPRVDAESDLNVFPNPFQNKLTVRFDIIEKVVLCIYNMNGEKIYERKIFSENFEIDLSSIPKGIYELSIQSASRTLTEKIVKI